MSHKKTLGAELGGNHPEGQTEADRLPSRIERYSAARHRATQMLHHLDERASDDPIEGKARRKLAHCGNRLAFHEYFTVGKVRLAEIHTCDQHLICPLCAIRRSAKSVRAYTDRLKVITTANVDYRHRLALVTFTVKNGPDLMERHTHLQNALRRLHGRRREYMSGKRNSPWSEAVKAEGALWSFEVTNRGKGWHPHVHALWLVPEWAWPDQDTLQREWQDITGDSFMVDVRPVDQEDPASGLIEVLKYAMKFSDLTLDQNLEAWRSFRGKRLLGSFGCFRGVQVPPENTDELLDDLPYIERVYRYFHGAGYSLDTWTRVGPIAEPDASVASAGHSRFREPPDGDPPFGPLPF